MATPHVEGFGNVYANPDTPSEVPGHPSLEHSFLVNNGSIFGLTLDALTRRTKLSIVTLELLANIVNSQFKDFVGLESPPKPFPYTNGDWDMKRYRSEIPRNQAHRAYNPYTKVDDAYDRQLIITQAVVQDIFWLEEDVQSLRTRPVRCIFLKDQDLDDQLVQEFIVLVKYSWPADEFKESMPRLVNGQSALGLAFGPPPSGDVRDKYWHAIESLAEFPTMGSDLVIKIRRPSRKSDPGDRNQHIKAARYIADASVDPNEFFLRFDSGLKVAVHRVEAVNSFFRMDGEQNELVAFQRDILVGTGFQSLLRDQADNGDETDIVWDIARQNVTAQPAQPSQPAHPPQPVQPRTALLPNIMSTFFNFCPADYLAVIRTKMGSRTQDRFGKFVEALRLPVMGIIGFAGSGKTELAGLVALMFTSNIRYGSIYCAAPTNVATSNIANRVHALAVEMHSKLPSARRMQMELPTVIRGHHIDVEVQSFITTVNGDTATEDKCAQRRWAMPLSICEWMLKVVEFGDYKLARADSRSLHALQKDFQEWHIFSGLRKFVSGKITFKELSSSGSVTNIIKDRLALSILWRANVVCTTPFLATETDYLQWNVKVAKATVLDEAGAMLQADALCVWINDGRPLVAVGDPRQLPLTVTNLGESRRGLTANMFGHLAKISILEHLKRVQVPIFVLDTQ